MAIFMVFLLISGTGAALEAVIVDVGAADCAILTCGDACMMIDTGYAKTWPHVEEVLDNLEVEEIDVLVTTHPHADHIGAVEEALASIEIQSVMMPPIEHSTATFEDMMMAIRAADIPVTYPEVGDDFQLGEATVQVLGPHPVAYQSINDWSIVLRVSYAGRSMLFCGDIEAEAEGDLIAFSDTYPLEADILRVAHHGSATSTTAAFVEAVRPEYAIISCDASEDKKYPEIEVATMLYEHGAEIYTTEVCGDIWIDIKEDGGIEIAEGSTDGF